MRAENDATFQEPEILDHGSDSNVISQNIITSEIFANVTKGLRPPQAARLCNYWQSVIDKLENEEIDFKLQQLPLARIKRVMKTDEDVKMISGEVPVLFAKGCELFITELTMRAWEVALENKRRTLQKLDIANAAAKSDMFDFLIDIVPRDDTSDFARFSSTLSGSYGAPSSAPELGRKHPRLSKSSEEIPVRKANQVSSAPTIQETEPVRSYVQSNQNAFPTSFYHVNQYQPAGYLISNPGPIIATPEMPPIIGSNGKPNRIIGIENYNGSQQFPEPQELFNHYSSGVPFISNPSYLQAFHGPVPPPVNSVTEAKLPAENENSVRMEKSKTR